MARLVDRSGSVRRLQLAEEPDPFRLASPSIVSMSRMSAMFSATSEPARRSVRASRSRCAASATRSLRNRSRHVWMPRARCHGLGEPRTCRRARGSGRVVAPAQQSLRRDEPTSAGTQGRSRKQSVASSSPTRTDLTPSRLGDDALAEGLPRWVGSSGPRVQPTQVPVRRRRGIPCSPTTARAGWLPWPRWSRSGFQSRARKRPAGRGPLVRRGELLSPPRAVRESHRLGLPPYGRLRR